MPSSSKPLFQFVHSHLQHLRSALAGVDSQQLARHSGFLRRLPRKVPIAKFLLALGALAAETTLSLERIAAVISLAAQPPIPNRRCISACARSWNSSSARWRRRSLANWPRP